MQQLAKHWAHKMTVRFDAEEATIAFPNGSRLEMQADSETLDCTLTVPEGEGEGVQRMRDVVEEHLNRFAFREGALTFDWRAAD